MTFGRDSPLGLNGLRRVSNSFFAQKNYHLSIKFENPDEIKLTVVGNVSKTRIESGEDLVLEVEFRPLLSFRKESVDRRYDICVNIVNGLNI